VLYDELKGLRGELIHERNERISNSARLTVLETEAGYVRKAVIGIVALLVIPVGKALALFISSIKV
jgi:hypothetical protein